MGSGNLTLTPDAQIHKQLPVAYQAVSREFWNEARKEFDMQIKILYSANKRIHEYNMSGQEYGDCMIIVCHKNKLTLSN